MTKNISGTATSGLIRLSGTIRNLKVDRSTASFVFTESDRNKLGVIAIAAAVAEMGGQAMSTTGSASAMEEEADYLEFDLNALTVKGWVWRNPFREEDVIEVRRSIPGSIGNLTG